MQHLGLKHHSFIHSFIHPILTLFTFFAVPWTTFPVFTFLLYLGLHFRCLLSCCTLDYISGIHFRRPCDSYIKENTTNRAKKIHIWQFFFRPWGSKMIKQATEEIKKDNRGLSKKKEGHQLLYHRKHSQSSKRSPPPPPIIYHLSELCIIWTIVQQNDEMKWNEMTWSYTWNRNKDIRKKHSEKKIHSFFIDVCFNCNTITHLYKKYLQFRFWEVIHNLLRIWH